MGEVTIHHGDCLDVLRAMPEASVDAVVTDPPYGLSATTTDDVVKALTAWLAGEEYRKRGGGFMGRTWDAFVPGPEVWREVLRVLKPGGHAVVFAGTRTADLMGMALRIAGFELRESLQWVYGSGFPKSLDISKAIDKAAGAEREITRPGIVERVGFAGSDVRGGAARGWDSNGSDNRPRRDRPATDAARAWDGWGTALKPAHEPILLARKPLAESTVAAQVLATGTGGINVDACRVASEPVKCTGDGFRAGKYGGQIGHGETTLTGQTWQMPSAGRWPPNVLHDGSPEVLEGFGRFGGGKGAAAPVLCKAGTHDRIYSPAKGYQGDGSTYYGDTGTAARFFPALGFTEEELRFFYSGKASKADRAGSKHPTIKPIALMRWLCRLITPPGGTVLDPFAGSGTTGEAALLEGFRAVLIEREAEYVADIKARLARMQAAKSAVAPSHPDLFADEAAA